MSKFYVMNKAWRRIDDKLLLYKRGNVGAVNLDKDINIGLKL